jgi:hypothetical protein
MNVVVAAALIVAPIALFVVVGGFMMRATGRARFRQTRRDPNSVPINFRLRGYDAADAVAYWRWLGEEGRKAEVRFLKADMVFPLWYGGLFVASLAISWDRAGRGYPLWPALVLVLLTLIGDWIENAVHLREMNNAQPSASLIRLASFGTQAKLVLFWVCTALMIAAAIEVALAG